MISFGAGDLSLKVGRESAVGKPLGGGFGVFSEEGSSRIDEGTVS